MLGLAKNRGDATRHVPHQSGPQPDRSASATYPINCAGRLSVPTIQFRQERGGHRASSAVLAVPCDEPLAQRCYYQQCDAFTGSTPMPGSVTAAIGLAAG